MSVIKKVTFGNSQVNQFMFSQTRASNVSTPQNYSENNNSKITDTNSRNIAYVSSAVALASLGVTAAIALKSRKKPVVPEKDAGNALGIVEQGLNSLRAQVQTLQARTDIDSKIQGFNDLIKGIEGRIKSIGEWNDGWLKALESKITDKSDFSSGWMRTLENRLNNVAARVSENTAIERNIVTIDNLNLLANLNSDGSRIQLDKEVVEEIQNVAKQIIHEKSLPPRLDPKATTWSLTAESIPEKEGGLGEVPVQIAKNMTHELKMNNFLLRPINEIPGVSTLVEKDGKWHYRFKDLNMEVDKVAEFDIYAFRNGRTEKQPVEVFYGIDPKFGFKRLMFRNKDFFGASGLYKDSQRASEKERFAFFPKAVYEFAKMKLDPNSQTSYRIFNEKIYNEIQAPDVMLLNDWHTAAMAGLAKILAPIEAAAGELSETAAAKLKKMNQVELIHNLDYQGSDWMHGADIMNTLYGKYAYDVYTNAKTGLAPAGLQNVHFIDGNINLANVAASLANKLKPVSFTYAQELGKEFDRSRSLQHIMQRRLEAGTMVGQSNGWDRVVNEISVKNLDGFNKNLNSDKFEILQAGFNSLELNIKDRKDVDAVFSIYNSNPDKLSFEDNFNKLVKSLRELGIPKVTKLMENLDAEGITKIRLFMPEVHTDDIETIMKARLNNKHQFLDLMKSMAEYNKTHPKFFNLAEDGVTDLSGINFDDLENQIVLDCGTRFVVQKGVDILAETMKQIYAEWPTKYPGKPKPIFPVGGKDGEGGKFEALMRGFKSSMGKDAERVPYMVGYTPNNIYQGGSDITLYPSWFEPDGSKWESLNKGTPVVATRVGGHVDSIVDGYNGYLSARTVPEVKAECMEKGYDYFETMVYDFKEAIYRACDDFFNKDKWKQMVRHSIDGDQSWLIKDKDGKILGGSLIGHLEDLGYNLDDFPMIANADVRKAFAESRKVAPIVEDAVKEPSKTPKISKPKKSRKSNKNNA